MSDQSTKNLKLVLATEKQIEHQDLLNSEQWRGALSQEAYLRREKYLLTKGIAANSGLTAWVLVDADAKPEEQEVYAGCETLRKRALVSYGGRVEDTTAYGICSVFTPRNHRGKKYGARMMHDLGKKLKTFENGSLFTALYSDIGKTFYAKEGWKPYPSSHISLQPEYSAHLLETLDSVLTPLEEKDLPHFCELDEKLLRERLAREQSTTVAFVPDLDIISWQHAREDFVANEIYHKKPTVRGAVARVGGQRVWAIFSRFWYNEDPKQRKENTLHILRLVIENEDAISTNSGDIIAAITAILRVAQHEAYEWNSETVELWNPRDVTLQAVKRLSGEAELVHRESESIASLKWYGDEALEDGLVWMENEKYGWC